MTAPRRRGRQGQVEALAAWDRAVAARTAAPGLLAAATERARVADEAIKPAQAALDQANAARPRRRKHWPKPERWPRPPRR